MTDERSDPVALPPGSETDTAPPSVPTADRPNRFATAGRLGAERVHRLIRLGLKYEQEHDLSRGRQRLRQLIELGKRYEEEHGLAAPTPRPRRSKEQVWGEFLHALARVVKPAYRAEVEKLAAALPAADRDGRDTDGVILPADDTDQIRPAA